MPNLRDDTYELSYNSACISLGKSQYSEAEKKLRTSEKLCRETLDEDDDIEEEAAIIKVQLAYCLQMQGKIKEATAIYSDVLKHKSSDVALTAVASNNMVAINKDQNVFDSKKKIRAAMADACEHKLTTRQKKAIALNNCLLTLYTNQDDQVHQLVSKLIQTYPDVEFKGLLIRITQLAKDKKFKDAIELLEKYGKANPRDELAIKFAVVQLLLMSVSVLFFPLSKRRTKHFFCCYFHRAIEKRQLNNWNHCQASKNINLVLFQQLFRYIWEWTIKHPLQMCSKNRLNGTKRINQLQLAI